MERRKELLSLLVGFVGAMLGLCAVQIFNRFLLMSLPLGLRMLSMPAAYWLIALVPILVAVANKDRLSNFGFTNKHIGLQIVTGILLGIAMSAVLTLIPHFFGLGMYVDNGHRYQHLWQFVYEFLYCIFAIGFVEEFVFRGYIYSHIKTIWHKEIAAIAGSSVLFGVFHLFGGSIVQMVITAWIGALFCSFRLKIKNCSILSLIIAHGIYDALITVWASLLL